MNKVSNILNSGAGATIINDSMILSAFNQVRNDNGAAVANALKELAAYIQKQDNRMATENFESMVEELAGKNARPVVLRALWSGVVSAIPAIAQLPAAIAFVANVLQS